MRATLEKCLRVEEPKDIPRLFFPELKDALNFYQGVLKVNKLSLVLDGDRKSWAIEKEVEQ